MQFRLERDPVPGAVSETDKYPLASVLLAKETEGDYLQEDLSTSASFTIGVATVDLSASTADDDVDEADGLVRLRLFARGSAGTQGYSLQAGDAVVLIRDNDGELQADFEEISWNSNPGADATYGIGDQIEIGMTWSRSFLVRNTAYILLDIGGIQRRAEFVGQLTGLKSALFRYTVRSDDQDADGISVIPLSLGGSVYSTHLDQELFVDTLHPGLDSTAKVDGARPVATLIPEDHYPPVPTQGYAILANFTEDVTYFTESDILVTGGEVSRGSLRRTSTDRTAWRFLVTPYSEQQELAITLPSGAVTDGAGNSNPATHWRAAMGQVSDAILVSLDPATVREGGLATEIRATVSLNHAPRDIDSVARLEIGDANDDAVRNQDYRAPDRQVVQFPAGQKSVTTTFTVTPINDTEVESDETLTIQGIMLGRTPGSATLTILDNDALVQLSVDAPEISESLASKTLRVTATLGGTARDSAVSVSVTFGVAGDSAEESRDYTRHAGVTVTIPAGLTSGSTTTQLDLLTDDLHEGPETISFQGATAISGLTVEGGVLTIVDDDAAPTAVTVALDPADVDENAESPVAVTVTARLDGNALGAPQTYVLSVGAEGDSAAPGSDYQAVNDSTLTIPAGASEGSGVFYVAPVNDGVSEGNKKLTVSIEHDSLPGGEAQVTLRDDEIDPTGIELSVTPTEISEDGGDQEVVITVTLNGAPVAVNHPVLIGVGHSADSATEGVDYVVVPHSTVTIPAGSRSVTHRVVLTPRNDSIAEGTETISVEAIAPDISLFAKAKTTFSLDDDDDDDEGPTTGILLSVTPTEISENGGDQEVVITVRLNGAPVAEDHRVFTGVGQSADSATEGVDYEVVPHSTVTIPAGSRFVTRRVVLKPLNDEIAEGTETISVVVVAPDISLFSKVETTISLHDDETAPVSLSLDPASVSEDGGAQQIEVTAELDQAAASEPTTVNVTVGRTGDSAASGTDYTSVASFVLTIPAGQTTGTATFTLTPDDDEAGEGVEEITVHGTASGLRVDDVTLTLNDDDAASTSVSLSLDPGSVSEDAGSVSVEVTAELNRAFSTEPTAVNVTVGRTGDSAIAGTDYTFVAGFVLTIPARQTTGTATFTLTPDDDEVAERVEEITVHGTASGLTVDDATLTLNDDDQVSTSVSLSLDPGLVLEDAGSVLVEVTAELNGTARTEPIAVNVAVGGAGDSAVSGTDYAPVAGFVLTIPGEQTTGTATFTLTPDDDEVAEGVEEITVHGTASGLTVDDATLTLNDQASASDLPEIRFVTTGLENVITEGGTVQFRLERDPVPGAVSETDKYPLASVLLAKETEGDYLQEDLSTSASFTIGVATVDLSASTVDDEVDEADGLVRLRLFARGSAGTQAYSLQAGDAVVLIRDNDGELQADFEDISWNSNPGADATYGIGDQIEIGMIWSRSFLVRDTAYILLDIGGIQRRAEFVGRLTDLKSALFRYTVRSDDQDADGISVIPLSLGGSVYSTHLDQELFVDTLHPGLASTAKVDGAPPVATLIPEDQYPPVPTQAYVILANFTEDVTGFTESDILVTGGELDRGNLRRTSTDRTAWWFVVIPYSEEQELAITLPSGAVTDGAGNSNPATNWRAAMGQVSDAILVSLDPATVREGGLATEIRATLSLNHGPRAIDSVARLEIGDANDDAVRNQDYRAPDRQVVQFPAGQKSVTTTFTVTPINDTEVESDETLTIQGIMPGRTAGSATLTILDNDALVQLSVDAPEISESLASKTLRVTATLGGTARDAVVSVSVTFGDAGDSAEESRDYTRHAGVTVTIPAGLTSGSTTTQLDLLTDNLHEGPETISFQGATAISGLTVEGGVLTIVDDDAAPTAVTVALDPADVDENAESPVAVTVTARLDGNALGAPQTYVLSVGAEGDSAAPGSDYQAVNDSTLTIPAGASEGSAVFYVAPVNDGVSEGNEKLTVSIEHDSLPAGEAQVTLRDDEIDLTGIELSVTPTEISEDGGDQEVVITVTLNGVPVAVNHPVLIGVGHSADSATEGVDYVVVPHFSVTIPAGSRSVTQRVVLTPRNDSIAEGTETISVEAIAPDISLFAKAKTTFSLDDDDDDDEGPTTGILLSVTPTEISENGGDQEVVITVRLNGAPFAEDHPVLTGVGQSADSATEGVDYEVVPHSTVTIPAGSRSVTRRVVLKPLNDEIAEGAETISVVVVAPDISLFAKAETTISLDDDDDDDEGPTTGILLSVTPTEISENGGDQEVVITVRLNGAPVAEDHRVFTGVGHSDDSATEGVDYEVVPHSTVTIPAGSRFVTRRVVLKPLNDEIAEGAETIFVQVLAPDISLFARPQTTISLDDDETASASVSLSLDPAFVSEDGGAQQIEVTAELDQAAAPEPTTVNVTVGRAGDSAASGTDYASVADFVLTIPAGQTTGTATFTLTPEDDPVAEGVEEITVHGTASGLTVDDATLTLNDDDQVSTSVSLSVDESSWSEDGGARLMTVTAALDQGARLEPTTVNVTVGRDGDSAVSGTDYLSINDVVITIPAKQTTGMVTFILAPQDDEFVEGAEEITVHGTASGLTVDDATLTLNDDEQASASVSLSVDPASVSEDAGAVSVQVTAELDGAAGLEPTVVNVTVGRAGDSAVSGTDYASVADFVLDSRGTDDEGPGTAHDSVGEQTTGTATFTLTPDDDEVAEGAEEITVHGTASGLTVDDATLTLNDDDQASASVSLSVDPASVSEDAGAVSVQVTAALDGAAGLEPTVVNVTVGRAGDSAVSGTDYASVADFVLTIPGEQTTGTATFTLTPDDDEVAEGAEEITVHGTASGLTVDDATLTLNDDDQASASVSLSVDPASVSEDAGAVSVQVTAELDGAAGLEPTAVNVTVGRAGDSAASGTDYASVADFVLTIPGEQTTGTATFTLTPDDDEVAEGVEEITVRGTASGLTVNDATLTVNDDDQASASVSLSVDPASVSEDAGAVSVQVTAELDGAAGLEPTTVNVTVGRSGDSAASGTDYASVAGFVLTIPARQTTGTATFTLTPDDDEVAEGVEEITVRGTASGLTVDDATLTLNDDDQASASVSLSVDPASVSEDAGAVSVQVTAELDGAAGLEPTAVNVTVGRSGDSAASGTDYTSVAGFVLTIPARQTTGTATFTLTPDDDEVAEGAEEITVHGTASGLTVDDVTLTLNDDDQASASVSLSVDPASVSEDAGAVSVQVTAELDGAAGLEPTVVNVTVGRAGDSAASGTDYASVAGFVLTIPAGQTTGTATFTLTPDDDEVAEGVEEITVRGTASGLTVDDATLTLNDDDQASASVSLSVDPASVSEDAGAVSVQVTAELAGAAGLEPTVVNVTVGRAGDSAASGTDYASVADFVLTIPARQTTGTATFTLAPEDDEVVEGPEEITVHGTASGLTVENATLALNDDDTPSTSVALSVSPASVSEDGGAQQIEVTAALDGAAGPEPTAVNVTVGRAGDSAASGTDYTSVAGFVLTIPARQTTGTATFTLAPEDDEVVEGPEEITVHGTASGLTVENATLALNDDDTPSTSVALSVSPASVSEDGGAQQIEVTAALDGAAGPEPTAVNVTVGRAGDSAVSGTDYTSVAGFVLTIPARQTTGTATFTLTPDDDEVAEGVEEITVHGTASGLTVDDVTLTLNDDDQASASVSLSVDPASVSEDAGAVSVQVTAELDGAAGLEPTTVNVTVGRSGDSAVSGTDYASVAGFVLTIPARQTTGTATFTLTPDDDEVAEGVEEITVRGTASGLTVDDATLTLNDDDQASASVSLSVDPASVSEDAGAVSVQVTAELDGAAGLEPTAVNVTVGRAGDSAASGTDYTSVAGFVLTIPARQTTGTATFTLTPDDDEVAEGVEEITVHGTASGLTVNDATLTLNDDDQASASVSLSVDPASVSEDAGAVSVQVTAELDGAAGLEPTAVNVTVGRAGDSAASGTDYTSVAGFVLTIPARQTTGTATFTLTPDDDEVAEGVEEITVRGTASGLTVNDATLTLNDDDQASASVSLSVDPASVSEDAGSVSVQVTAELDGAAGLEPTAVNVTVGRAGDSAASGTDYASVADFVLTIPGEQTTGTATFTLTPDDDEVVEGAEEITVRGTASGLTVDDATLTLNDDDQASASVSLSVDPASVSEDAGAVSVQVTAELDGAAGLEPTAVNVTVGRAGDSAGASGTDYASVADFVLTIPGLRAQFRRPGRRPSP